MFNSTLVTLRVKAGEYMFSPHNTKSLHVLFDKLFFFTLTVYNLIFEYLFAMEILKAKEFIEDETNKPDK